MTWRTLFALAGGLGLFLYGMHLMSEGLTNVAGAKLRSVLEKMTKNVFVGTMVGLIFTAIIQSSSATTVLVVSFVNAGLMNLYQASGVIMGANIGTTVTGLLMTINLQDIAPMIVFIGVIMVQFSKKEFIQKLGQVTLGFGVLFVGLSSMSSAMEALKDSPLIIQTLSTLKSPLLAILIGGVVTAILQSASAMVGILIVMASQGMVSLEMSFYMMLGCNIGCCVSAILASIGGSTDAKRAAAIHLTINVIGTIVMGVLLALFMPQMISFITTLTNSAGATGLALGKDVAYSNTIFKVFQILLVFPFYKQIVRFVTWIIPDKDEKKPFGLQYIDMDHAVPPAAAVPLAARELDRVYQMSADQLNLVVASLLNVDTSTFDEIHKNEENMMFLTRSIYEYLVRLDKNSILKEDLINIGPLIYAMANIERINTHTASITKCIQRCAERNISFHTEHRDKINELLRMVNQELTLSIQMFDTKDTANLEEILRLQDAINNREQRLQKDYLTDMRMKAMKPRTGMLYSDVVSDLARIADHAANIAISIIRDSDVEANALLEKYHIAVSQLT